MSEKYQWLEHKRICFWCLLLATKPDPNIFREQSGYRHLTPSNHTPPVTTEMIKYIRNSTPALKLGKAVFIYLKYRNVKKFLLEIM